MDSRERLELKTQLLEQVSGLYNTALIVLFIGEQLDLGFATVQN